MDWYKKRYSRRVIHAEIIHGVSTHTNKIPVPTRKYKYELECGHTLVLDRMDNGGRDKLRKVVYCGYCEDECRCAV